MANLKGFDIPNRVESGSINSIVGQISSSQWRTSETMENIREHGSVMINNTSKVTKAVEAIWIPLFVMLVC